MGDVSPAQIHIDDYASPWLPWAIRALNAVGEPAVRRLVRLDEDDLLAAARKRTGLDDFGDPSFLEPFRLLLDALERKAHLSAFGRISTRQLLLQLLSSRLLIEERIKRHPEILEEKIERPIIIAGPPRTGTTHLFNLIAQDSDLRTLPYWESLEPLLPEKEQPAPGQPDPRIARAEKSIAFLDWMMPHFRAMHEFTADGPHEEIQLLAIHFSTQLFEASYDIPSYAEWYRTSDQTPAYQYLKRVLQVLQWIRRGTRWVLKTPQHLENLKALTVTFPDARFIQTHRDPVPITASLVTMIAYGRRMQTRAAALDPIAIGHHWAKRLEDSLRSSVEHRHLLPPSQVFDVPFREFMQDSVGMVERVFAFAEQQPSPHTAAAIRTAAQRSPRGKHGTIVYRLEDFGLDAKERRRALRFYQERFNVPSEGDE